MKLKWKRFFGSLDVMDWIKLLTILFIFLVGLITIFKFLFIGETVTTETPVGSYTCKGGIIKVCSGSSEVASYLGVE